MSELAERLRKLRGPLTQQSVGELLGCSAALVSSWETGAAAPPENRLAAYAAQLGEGSTDIVLRELLALRDRIVIAKPSPTLEISDLLREIKAMLLDISRRLPKDPAPRPHSWDEQPEND